MTSMANPLTGKLGAPVHLQSQFLYFDVLSLLPTELEHLKTLSEFATPTPSRENALVALFGASFLQQRLQQSVLSFVGMEATNVELLKVGLSTERKPILGLCWLTDSHDM